MYVAGTLKVDVLLAAMNLSITCITQIAVCLAQLSGDSAVVSSVLRAVADRAYCRYRSVLGPTSHWVCFYCVGYTFWRTLLLLKTSVTLTPCFLIASVCCSAFVAHFPVGVVRVNAIDIRYFLQCVLPHATSRLRWMGQMHMKLSSSCCWCCRFIGWNISDIKQTLNSK